MTFRKQFLLSLYSCVRHFQEFSPFFGRLFLGADFSDLANGNRFHTNQHYICPQSQRLCNVVRTLANLVGESVASKCLAAGRSLLLAP